MGKKKLFEGTNWLFVGLGFFTLACGSIITVSGLNMLNYCSPYCASILFGLIFSCLTMMLGVIEIVGGIIYYE